MTHLLLVTSNGTGMGHLMRQVAVASASDNPSTIFSLSLGLPHATKLGVQGEYCPSYDRPWIASAQWHGYLKDRLVAITRETKSSALIFDGVAPYPGIGRAADALRDVAFIWLRRGMWQAGTGYRHLSKSHYFDLVIEPGDLGASLDSGPTAGRGDAVDVGPISITETVRFMSREEARNELGLPQDGPVALVTLGSGRLGDVAGPGRVAVDTLLNRLPEWHIAVTKSPVALNEIPAESADRITKLSGVYPLARYLKAFDLGVSSAGYNAVHELIPAQLPTLFVANTSTRTDDQRSRARGVAAAGLALHIDDWDLEPLPDRIELLAMPETLTKLQNACRRTAVAMTGAGETRQIAADFAEQFTRRQVSLGSAITSVWQRSKDSAKVRVGEERTAKLKSLLGRGPSLVHGKMKVTLDPKGSSDKVPLLTFPRELTAQELNGIAPVEHLLPESSAGYEEDRRKLARTYYEIVD